MPKHKLEELPGEQKTYEEWLDRIHRKVKDSSVAVEYVYLDDKPS